MVRSSTMRETRDIVTLRRTERLDALFRDWYLAICVCRRDFVGRQEQVWVVSSVQPSVAR